jgi:aspartate/methionine/tyrosine aminotransferase
MNQLALELNEVLDETVAGRLLSSLGKSMFFPRGIVAQTAEAKERADRFNATLGMAYENRSPMMLSGLASMVNGLSAEETVAYAPTPGVPELRNMWKQAMAVKNPSLAKVSMSTPMVTPGLTNGLLQIADLFVDPGDAVIMPDLFWGNYRLIFETRCRGQIVTFPLIVDGRFNTSGLAAALDGREKAVVLLNLPNNPAGYAPSREEATAIAKILVDSADRGTDLLTVFDDAYFGLFYEDDTMTESLFAACADAHKRILAVKIDGATKEDFAWGFRIGFITFAGRGLKPRQLDCLERKLMGSIRSTVSNSSRIAQSMLLKALRSKSYQEEKLQKRAILKKRYERVKQILNETDTSPLVPLPFNSGFFMSFDCTPVNAEELRLALLDRGIGTVSIQERYLRIAYSMVDEQELPVFYGEIVTEAKRLASQLGTK